MGEEDDYIVPIIPPTKQYRSLAELREARAAKSKQRSIAQPKKKQKYIDKRRTVRKCVSVPPELYVRAQRDLGRGNFSKAIVEALREALKRWDRENGVRHG